MSREIKFRAWNKKNKAWIYESKLVMNSNGKLVCPYSDKTWGAWAIDYEIVFYTGLLDKNGKEIYESDIVKILSDDFPDENEIKKIVWASDACGFFFEPSKESSCGDFTVCIGSGETECFELEIIGNRYENPELLEKVK